jgi:hypothetical protein
VYQKAPVALKYLAAYMGQEKFDLAMQAYFEKWKFKHPYPEDMQAIFEETAGEKLDWFFKDLLQTTEPVDIAIKKADKTAAGGSVTLKNEGEFAAPVPVVARNEQGQITETKWTKPFEGKTTVTFSDTQASRFELDPDYLLPESDRRDNQFRTSGILRKMEKPRLQLLAGIEQNRKQQLYFMPVIGANTADKFMLGAAFYNSSLMAKKINYLVMPMYSFDQHEVNGIGNINYNLVSHSNSFIRQVIFGFNFQRFEYYTKNEPSVTFNFRQKEPASPRQQLKLAVTSINQQGSVLKTLTETSMPSFSFAVMHLPEYIGAQTITYKIWKTNAIQDLGLEVQYQHLGADPQKSNDQTNVVRATAMYERYWNKNNKFSARLFGGKFFSQAMRRSLWV